MNQVTTTYDQFVLVSLAFSAYSGQVTLDKATMGNNIDPSLVSAGNIKTVSRDALNIFGTIKAQARTECLRYGTSFMGGYAIPLDKWDYVQEKLNEIVAKYENEAANFVANYINIVTDWANLHPSDKDLIIERAHPADWIKDRFKANFFGCSLSPAKGMEESMNKEVEGMFESICNDLANDAKQAIRAYQKGSKITVKMKSTFEAMIDKINALSFVNSALAPLGETLSEQVSDLFPPEGKGKIDEEIQSKIALILSAMTDPTNLPNLSDILKIEMSSKEEQVKEEEQVTTEANSDPLDSPKSDDTDSFTSGFTFM